MSLIFIEFAWWVYLGWLAAGALTVTAALSLTRHIRQASLRVLLRAAGIAMGLSPTALLVVGEFRLGLVPLPAWHGILMGFSDGNEIWIWTSLASIAFCTFLFWLAGMVLHEGTNRKVV